MENRKQNKFFQKCKLIYSINILIRHKCMSMWFYIFNLWENPVSGSPYFHGRCLYVNKFVWFSHRIRLFSAAYFWVKANFRLLPSFLKLQLDCNIEVMQLLCKRISEPSELTNWVKRFKDRNVMRNCWVGSLLVLSNYLTFTFVECFQRVLGIKT